MIARLLLFVLLFPSLVLGTTRADCDPNATLTYSPTYNFALPGPRHCNYPTLLNNNFTVLESTLPLVGGTLAEQPGPPAAAACDQDSELRNVSRDTTTNKVYLCASGGWVMLNPSTTGGSGDPGQAEVCGNGVIDQTTEECDTPGGVGQIDAVNTNCKSEADCNMASTGRGPCTCPVDPPQACGDGRISGTEVCDEPGIIGARGCTALQVCASNCLSCASQPAQVCGDGVITAPEICDDRLKLGATGCDADKVCATNCLTCGTCGDGVLDANEACDPGGSLSTPPTSLPQSQDAACTGLCTTLCTCPPPVCGNGVVETGEECDGGVGACSMATCVTCHCQGPVLQTGTVYEIAPGTTGSDSNNGFRNVDCVATGNPNPCCTGSGVGTCTGPYRTFERAINKASLHALGPGDTLLLLDGEYDKTNNHPLVIACSGGSVPDPWYAGDKDTGTVQGTCTSAGKANCGTADKPITIKAQHPRKAHFHSDGSWLATYVVGCRYWVLEDYVATTQDNPYHSAPDGKGGVTDTSNARILNDLGNYSPMVTPCVYYSGTNYPSCGDNVYINGSQNITARGLLVSGNNRYQNASTIDAYRSADILFDKIEAYKSSRNNPVFMTNIRSEHRGNFATASNRGGLFGGTSTGSGGGQQNLLYVTDFSSINSCVSDATTEGGWGDGGQVGGQENKIYGYVAYGGDWNTNARPYSSNPLNWSGMGTRHLQIENFLKLKSSSGTPMYFRSNHGLKVRNYLNYDLSLTSYKQGLTQDDYDPTSTDSLAVGCNELKDSPTGAVGNICSGTFTNVAVVGGASTPTGSTGFSISGMPSPIGTNCVFDHMVAKNTTYKFSGQGSSCTNTAEQTANYNLTNVGLATGQCLVVPTTANANLGASGSEGRGYCYGGTNDHVACTGAPDCEGGGTCQYPVGPDLACTYEAGVRQTGPTHDMWVAGATTAADCIPATHVTTDANGVKWPNCNGHFYGCGPIVTGLNDFNNTFACADFHERIGLKSDGTICARPTCGSVAGVTTTTTTTTTTTSTTSTTAPSFVASSDLRSYLVQFYTLDESANSTRANNSSTVCGSSMDLSNANSVGQDTSEKKEGTAAASFPGSTTLSRWPQACAKFSGSVTVSLWSKLATVTGAQVLAGSFSNATHTGFRVLADQASGKLQFAVANGTSETYCAPQSYATGAWHAYGGTYNSGTGVLDSVHDGIAGGGSCSLSSGISWTSHAVTWKIGDASLTGLIDEVAIANGAWTTAQIAKLQSCGGAGERCKCDAGTPANYYTCSTAADCGGAPAVCTNSQCRGHLTTSATLAACDWHP